MSIENVIFNSNLNNQANVYVALLNTKNMQPAKKSSEKMFLYPPSKKLNTV